MNVALKVLASVCAGALPMSWTGVQAQTELPQVVVKQPKPTKNRAVARRRPDARAPATTARSAPRPGSSRVSAGAISGLRGTQDGSGGQIAGGRMDRTIPPP